MEQRKILQQFNEKQLKELRRLSGSYYSYMLFWDELETVLRRKISKNNEWERMSNNDVILGEVWSQSIGEFYYKHSVHKFAYLYVKSEGMAIAEHKQEEPANGGRQIRKIKEWFIFPDGKINIFGKDDKHYLFNNYGKPIYVLSMTIGGKGTH